MKKEKESESVENRVDSLLNEIINQLNFMYLSDIRVEQNKKQVLQYIKEKDICEKDPELYDYIMNYLKK